MEDPIVIGVDVGGSHITAALVDLKQRTVLKDTWTRFSVNSALDATQIIADWSFAIKEAFGLPELNLTDGKVGIGMPGPFDYENGISFIKDQDKYDALYGMNVKLLLADELGISADEIRLMNDAACFLQGEMFGGAGRGFDCAVGLTLGTGLGSAFYKDGFATDAALWNCPFKDSIAEDYLSSRWFVKRYAELSGGKTADAKQLSLLIETDAFAQQIFNEFGANLAAFLQAFLLSQPVDLVILGGNIVRSFHLFEESLRSNLQTVNKTIEIKTALLGEEAAILGASSLWYAESM